MSGPRTILIIDDDADFATAVAHLLERAGLGVKTAGNGREGYDMACALAPDLILLDVMMNERTEGFFTLQRIRGTAALKDTPVIVISSIYGELPFFRIDPSAGWLPATLFLPKPVAPERLLAEVTQLLAAAPPARSVAS
jgi:CheY-like chemotaxis protein